MDSPLTESEPPPTHAPPTHAPSSHRGLLGLAVAGLIVASYLTLYQLGLFTTVWEPFFGDGSRVILHSSLARSLPIPDASLGALGYLAEALCVIARSPRRIWINRCYYALVILFTAGSAILVSLQWGYFHAWCTLCLTSAVISFIIAGVALHEVLMGKA